jgi:2-dehydropantoate 2-reductase
VARGEHLAALRRDGLAVTSGRNTAVVTTQNGVDAPGQVADVVGRSAVLPGAAEVIAFLDGPGRVRRIGGGKLTFGEWDNRPSTRVTALRDALEESGLTAVVATDVWAALWEKFLALASLGAIGTVTDAPYGVLRARAGTRQLIVDSMTEIERVARAKGVRLAGDIVAAEIAFLDRLPENGTTSLQRDIRAGRPSELEAWTGTVVRLGRETGTPTPVNSLLHELASTRAAGGERPRP